MGDSDRLSTRRVVLEESTVTLEVSSTAHGMSTPQHKSSLFSFHVDVKALLQHSSPLLQHPSPLLGLRSTSEATSDVLCNVYEASWSKGSLLFILSLRDADGAVRGHGGGTKDQIIIMPDGGSWQSLNIPTIKIWG